LQFVQVLGLLFTVLSIFSQLLLHPDDGSFQSFDGILDVDDQFFRFFCFKCPCVDPKIPKN
jgi:hypothetical protein